VQGLCENDVQSSYTSVNMRTRECQARYPRDKIKAKFKVAVGGIVEGHTEADIICVCSFPEYSTGRNSFG